MAISAMFELITDRRILLSVAHVTFTRLDPSYSGRYGRPWADKLQALGIHCRENRLL